MERKYLIAINICFIFVFICCQSPQKRVSKISQKRDSLIHQTDSCQKYEKQHEQVLSLLKDFLVNNDTISFRCAKKLLDSINIEKCPKIKFINTKVYILTIEMCYEEAITYLQKIPQKNFVRQYSKSMYINSMQAFNYKIKEDKRWVVYYKNAITPIISYLLKHPSDVQALVDFYYLKTVFKGKKIVLKELEEKMSTDSLNRDVYEGMRNSFETISEQLIFI